MADDDVIRIPLRSRDGSVRAWAIVDREDEDLAELVWFLNGCGYAGRNVRPANTASGKSAQTMHRIILARSVGRTLSRDEQCDHINGVRLDNRRENLRTATHGQNVVNRRGRGASVYLGVSRNGVGWRAQIVPLGTGREKASCQQIGLGTYATEAEAARAYDRAAREYHGEYARLNFPDGGDA